MSEQTEPDRPAELDGVVSWIERQASRYADHAAFRGDAWWQLSQAEQEVFRIPIAEMPVLVATYKAYQALAGIAYEADLGEELCAKVRAACPWIEEACMEHREFLRFAKIAGVSNRLASAFYAKAGFHDVRAGLVRYADERGGESC